MTGVPITKLDSKETAKLLKMESLLSNKVIGQEEAITSISKAIRLICFSCPFLNITSYDKMSSYIKKARVNTPGLYIL